MTTISSRPGDAMRSRVGMKLSRLFGAFMIVNAVFLAPQWLRGGEVGPVWLAVEAVVLVGAFAFVPRRRLTTLVAWALSISIVLLVFVSFADTAVRLSLGRPLSLYTDAWLLSPVQKLAFGTLGPVPATVGFLIVLGLVCWTVSGLARLLVSRAGESSRALTWTAALSAGVFVAVGFTIDRMPRVDIGVDAPIVRLAREQTGSFIRMMGERDRFEQDIAAAPPSYESVPGLLGHLSGRDVIFGFIESYGVTAIFDPRYAPVVGPRIDDLERRMTDAGLHIVSGKLVAPSQGGQSWFAHGSLLSGLWLDSQRRYQMMLASDRETLIDDFERAGHRTVAIMPAITMAWPEGDRLGYDEIFAYQDIGYAGPPLNWVTMPDQFTWSFLEQTIRPSDRSRPIFAELALISSHAPWTPILPVLDWDGIGDGSVFAPWKNAGRRPRELWLDHNEVREHYAMSVEYAIHVATSYAERYVDERTLLIILGDHQPAPLITGEDAVRNVPVHVISGDPSLVEPFLDWGFVKGAWPERNPEMETLGVDHFRDWFVRTYSRGPISTDD